MLSCTSKLALVEWVQVMSSEGLLRRAPQRTSIPFFWSRHGAEPKAGNCIVPCR